MVVEVMGRYAGWIALHSGVAATADAILIPEIPFNIDHVCDKITDREAHGRRFSIVVVAEGAIPEGGTMVVKGEEIGREVLLGGIGEHVAREIATPDRERKPGRWSSVTSSAAAGRPPSIVCSPFASAPRRFA